MNHQYKLYFNKKKAFTLIELLIVIAIIGILFIVLVSKVDFATDKAKATGVQTDFRSFQMAFDTVAKENAGFNTFGWDTGDANQDGIRNSYDEGDANKDGIQTGTEVFTGHKVYSETFTKVYSLKKNGTGSYDRDALNRLETAINANLDPKLHITIKDDGEIVMANGAQDPWNKEYHGWYITNAETDKKDRGAIVMYSDGANNKFGSEHKIANGIVGISIPGNNKDGKDDYSLVVCYTYTNGYGEVGHLTTGFSNNQTFMTGNGVTDLEIDNGNGGGEVVQPDTPEEPEISVPSATFNDGVTLSWDDLKLTENGTKYGYKASGISNTSIGNYTFENCTSLTKIIIPDDVVSIGEGSFWNVTSLTSVILSKNLTVIPKNAFRGCVNLESITIPSGIQKLGYYTFMDCKKINSINIPSSINTIDASCFQDCTGIQNVYIEDIKSWCEISFGGYSANPLYYTKNMYINNEFVTDLVIPNNVTSIGNYAFYKTQSLVSVVMSDSVLSLGKEVFRDCKNLTSVQLSKNITTIEELTFGHSGLKDITLHEGLLTIGKSAFCYTNISNMVIPRSVTTIDESAFSSCNSLTEVAVLGPTNLVSSCFAKCKNLTNVTLSDDVTYIGYNTFSGTQIIDNSALYVDNALYINNHLITVRKSTSGAFVVRDGTKTIAAYAFYNCEKLTSIEMPDNVCAIGRNIFNGCTLLTHVVLSKNIDQIPLSAFLECESLSEVNYNGTVEQWNSLSKGLYWIDDSAVTKIICSDGTVTVN